MMKRALLVVFGLFGLASVAWGQADSGDSGRLALTGVDGNIYVYDVATQERAAVTRDGSARFPQRYYQWPTWASDGQLAFFGTSFDTQNPFGLGIFILAPGAAEAKGVYAAENEVFTYAHWSPGGRHLAVLYNTRQGLATRLIDPADDFRITEAAQGGPHYWDFSPDGESMIWARFSTTYEIYDVAADRIALTLPATQGRAQSPDWSPVDGRLLLAVSGAEGATDLVIVDGDETRTLAEGLSGVAYEWSPDGTAAAYIDLTEGGLVVVDASTAQPIASPARGSFAFFWSPDSQKIAFLVIPDAPRGPGAKLVAQRRPTLEWRVWDRASDRVTTLRRFIPTSDMVYYLNFFDQFARSHRLWSPDSRYLAYGEVASGGESLVRLIDLQNPNQEPVIAGAGTVGIFSW